MLFNVQHKTLEIKYNCKFYLFNLFYMFYVIKQSLLFKVLFRDF